MFPRTIERLKEIGEVTDATENECWQWRDVDMYGQLERRRVHVISLEIKLNRKLNKGEFSLHKCDYPPCFNPNHLYAGSQKENIADMLKRFGGPQGSYGMSSAERSERMRGPAGEKARKARWDKYRAEKE